MKFSINNTWKISIAAVTFLLLMAVYSVFFASSINVEEPFSLYIYPKTTKDEVLKGFVDNNQAKKTGRISLFLKVLGAKNELPAGHYKITPGISDFKLARMLKGGVQTPVKLTFNNIRTVEQLAGRLSQQIMADSATILSTFKDTVWMSEKGFNKYNYMSIFIPNTYEIWWNTSTEKLLTLFLKEYDNFWSDSRSDNAKKIRMTPLEVSTLASIVEEETNKSDEMPKVAGLYINRLRIDMPLQADPTVKFAVGDFTLKRILKGHTKTISPYNTYLNIGLPPGPIRIPSIKAIEAVLFYEKHSYLYMCAKSDFSGYHAFATTLSQHNNNASKYHQALNSRGILE